MRPGPDGSVWDDILDTGHAVVVRTYIEQWPRRDRPPEKVLIVVVEPDGQARHRCPQCGLRGKVTETGVRRRYARTPWMCTESGASEPAVNGFELVGPLLMAGLGSGMTIAPNQDFVLATVPRREAGTAAGVLGTSQRLGTAIGIAVVGTVLFGSLKFTQGPHAVASAFTHSAQLALLANLAFVIVALALVVALPRTIPGR